MIGINHQENYEAFLHNQAKIGRYDNFIDKNPYATFTDFEEYDALQKYYANMPDGDNSDIPIFAAKVGDYSEKLINDPHARSQFINEYLRPALETGAMMAGGLSSGFAAKNPYLALLGGAGGYVVGKNTADNLDYYFGLGEGKPQGLMQSIAKTFDDYYDGLKQEAIGAILPFGVMPVVANSLKKSKIAESAGKALEKVFNTKINKPQPLAPFMEDVKILWNIPRLLKGEVPYVKTGHLNDGAAKIIKEKTGVDLTGYNIAFSQSDMQHIFKHHGDNILYPRDTLKRPTFKTELLTLIDDMPTVAKLPNSFDDVYLSKDVGKNGLPCLVFVKNLPDGLVIVTEAQTRYGNLSTTTAFKVGRKGMSEEETLEAVRRYKEVAIKK